MHWPKLALLSRAICSFSGIPRVRVNSVKRKVPKRKEDFPCINVESPEFREGIVNKTPTKGTLKLRKLDDYHTGCRIAL